MYSRKAFTLLEVVVATLVAASLMLLISYVLRQAWAAWGKGDRRLEMCQNARSAIDVMNREIRTSFISASNQCLFFKGDSSSLNFISASHEANTEKKYDLCEVEYYLKDSYLERMVKSDLDCRPGEGGARATLAESILEVSFGYYGGRKWHTSWDSTMGTPDDTMDDVMPEMVKIMIKSQDKEGKEKPMVFSTIVHIRGSG